MHFARFRVERILRTSDLSSAEFRDEALAKIAPTLGELGEGALREELVARTADRLQLGPAIVDRVVRAAPRPAQADAGSGRLRPATAGRQARRAAGPQQDAYGDFGGYDEPDPGAYPDAGRGGPGGSGGRGGPTQRGGQGRAAASAATTTTTTVRSAMRPAAWIRTTSRSAC